MVALIGFLMIIAIVALLLKGKMSPIVVLAVVPVIAALILGYSPLDIADFIKEGIKTTTSNGILFIFSVIYFGVLSDTGLFDVIVNWLVKKAGNNVIAITVATALVATIAHLDGTTATTVLITIPSLYPIYKKMNIDPKILLCITGACMGVMNLLPWGGPTARAATVLQMDANELWHILIPIQVAGFVINIALGVLLGMYAMKHGAGAGKGEAVEVDEKAAAEADALRKSNPFLIFNLILTVGVIAILSAGLATSYVVFLVALCILLAVNYPDQKLQDKLIKKHAPAALIISATLFAAGAMVGIFDGTGMLTEMANAIMGIIPSALGRFIHIIFGILALPLGLCVGTDAYFYGIMPLVMQVGETYGVASLSTALTMVIGKNIALMVSPLVPATFLAIGLTNTELKDHMKFSIPLYYVISLLMLLLGIIFGIIPL
ncbi:citrate transporter, CitMHS family [Lachnospiraceae bacterium JC7]|uniref:CitMHS family transporter n=1 Tax=Oribacterium sp. C9 TaxID=1943579 RepID=UPI0003DF15AD|nr:citrate:proton symporter [Oribacterium sp. C9]ETP72815.1 citrate transporter, CitMHS family [Lachnospiraceae bacterium JC7]